ncbi:MAG: ribonucleotide-diphosphate reductase subunit beta [Candidatus Magasanikbacteria bacterium]|jgi:ribonucleoside-diphosphate reductase beta chain|nr:ribonucleotide-diphosphate reductase subunit beta [Candidatus Magasanikbacteria bacterium]MBT5262850.1 ribonucleotide-diphosphate reductase subunit beta [Candidatus Magasanikbacteria bacterium]MBT5820380.1 ribonucleotide-diphosphate reductase subunit beta [Candidatus Magasanikbacteria bacterium]MBT6294775.1 ribonucleotide-diphosphate reductase subunit beta [Candidatus Magasanikbacteria bacterium]
MAIEKTQQRVDINTRKIINGADADVVQLYPMKHTFAWDAYNAGNANHWLPTEINMQGDVEQWKTPGVLTDDEIRAFKTVLGFFTTADSIAANNIVMAAYRHVTSPECRMYLLRQAYEEAVHTHAYQYMVESLGLDSGEIYNMYREVDAIYNKASFILTFNDGIFDPSFKTGTFESDQKFLENIIVFSLIMEGIFFYSSFAVIFGFQRQNKMKSSAEQIQYIMRDESQHLNFGINLINTIKEEQPELWTPEFQQHVVDMVKEGAKLEYTFAAEVFPKGIFGMNAESFKQYIEHISDRRLARVGLPEQFGVSNPFPWMSEAVDLNKEKNFFETRVIEYKTGGTLDW